MELKPYQVIANHIKGGKAFLPVHEKAGENLVELKPKLDSLSQDQEEALMKLLFSDANVVVISGNAGTGKTTVQHLATELLSTVFEVDLVKTAAFGIAALNMGGATLASVFGLRINHVLPWFDDKSVMRYRLDEYDYANGMREKDQSKRVSINEIYGKFNKYRKLKFSKPIYWFIDEFSTVTSEQMLVCYQLLQRLNPPNRKVKVICFGQPIQMLSPSIGTDEYGLNKHSRAWETAKFNLAGYYTSEELYPADEDNPEVFADERDGAINYHKELNHTCGGDLDRMIIFNSTKSVEYGSLLVSGQGPYIKHDKNWKVIYHCLTKNHRQGESLAFANICTAIAERKPIEDNDFWRPLLDRITAKVDKTDVEKAVWLVRTHKRKDNINADYLRAAKRKHGESIIYRSQISLAGRTGFIDSVDTKKQIIYFWGKETDSTTPYPYGHLAYAHAITNFFNCLSIPVKQELVPSLPVISRLNIPEWKVANGTVGYIYRTEEDCVYVHRPDTGEEQQWKYVTPSLVPRNKDGFPLFDYQTIPCHQANALTFQSCQGLTITGKGVIDVDMEMLKGADGFNSAGAMYVNLTRFTKLENLTIRVPNDAYTDAHLLNEVIFMDDSSVEFMDFIKEATPYQEKPMIYDNGAGSATVEIEEEEEVTEPEIEVYYDCEYVDDTLYFTLDGKRSRMRNLPDPKEVCGLQNVIFKQSEDDYYDVLIWLFADECANDQQALDYIERGGLINYLKSKGIDHQYIMVMVGQEECDEEEEVNEKDEEETVEEDSEEESSSELETLRKENAELKAQLANSVSRQEFDELKDQLAKITAMLSSKKK
jgi:hypothetical protein